MSVCVYDSIHVCMSRQQKFKNARNLTHEEKKLYQEIRRQTHISAEQKRRGSIKQGFEQLQSLVVNPSLFPSGKVSKAIILEKCKWVPPPFSLSSSPYCSSSSFLPLAVEYLQQQQSEREARERRIKELKGEIAQLNRSIALSQQQLPASGAPITRQVRLTCYCTPSPFSLFPAQSVFSFLPPPPPLPSPPPSPLPPPPPQTAF